MLYQLQARKAMRGFQSIIGRFLTGHILFLQVKKFSMLNERYGKWMVEI